MYIHSLLSPFEKIQDDRLAAVFGRFLLQNKFVCQRQGLRDGQADLLEILHGIGTWCVVDARLF